MLRGVSAAFGGPLLHVVRSADPLESDALLRVVGLLEAPDDGDVLLRGKSTRDLDAAARAECRSQHCGYVFAAPFLLGGFTIIENVAMPLFKIAQVGPEEARCRTVAALEFVGLGEWIEVAATELPPADQRRAALARALVHEPAAIFIEHLDAGLDAVAADEFAALVRRACAQYGITAIASASAHFQPGEHDRVIDLAGGCIRHDSEAVRGT